MLRQPSALLVGEVRRGEAFERRRRATARRRTLTAIQLPACVPDLNAVEGAWAVMKNGLGNRAAGTTSQLAAAMRHQLNRIQRRPALITGFLSGVRIVATSRTALGVEGEQVFGLRPPSLPPPDADVTAAAGSDAVMLFVQRAAGARGEFALSASNVAAVGEVCRRPAVDEQQHQSARIAHLHVEYLN